MSLRSWWGARRERARHINDQLAARDCRSRLDELDQRRAQASLDRLWGETVETPVSPRTTVEIRARVESMIHAAETLLSTPEGGSYTRGGLRSLERLLAWIDGDDDD